MPSYRRNRRAADLDSGTRWLAGQREVITTAAPDQLARALPPETGDR